MEDDGYESCPSGWAHFFMGMVVGVMLTFAVLAVLA